MPIRGLKEHQSRLRKLPAVVEREVTKALFAGAEYIGNVAALSITNGAVSGKDHVASKPGEAPNADTHVLDRSIQPARFGKLKAKVIVTAPYAVALEKGTSKMAARPFLVPARNRSRGHVKDLVTKAMNEALKRSR